MGLPPPHLSDHDLLEPDLRLSPLSEAREEAQAGSEVNLSPQQAVQLDDLLRRLETALRARAARRTAEKRAKEAVKNLG